MAGEALGAMGGLASIGAAFIGADASKKAAQINAQAQLEINRQLMQLQREQDRSWYGFAPVSAEKDINFYAPYKTMQAMGGATPSRATREFYQALPGQYLPGYQGNLNSILSGQWGANQVNSLAPVASARLNLAAGAREGALSAINQAQNAVMATQKARGFGSGGTPFLQSASAAMIPYGQQAAMATSQAQLENAMQAEQVRQAAEQYRQGVFQQLPQAVGQMATINQIPWQAMGGEMAARQSMFGGLQKKFPLQYPPIQAPFLQPTLPAGAAALGGAGAMFAGLGAQQAQQAQQQQMMDFLQRTYGTQGGWNAADLSPASRMRLEDYYQGG